MLKKNPDTIYAQDMQVQNNTLAIGIMQERFKNVEQSLEEIKSSQDKNVIEIKAAQHDGFKEIKDLLTNGYVTTEQHERLRDEVKSTSDIMKLIRNIVITALIIGLLALLGIKST